MTDDLDRDESTIYQLKITLAGVRPPIWRRLLVPASYSLADLHDAIQAVMGWTDSHLHQFIVDDLYYGLPHTELEGFAEVEDETLVSLHEIIPGKDFSFDYEYDFGDSWLHEVLVEEVKPADTVHRYPVCIGGRRACPPEDVGGTEGYRYFLEAICNRRHPEHQDMLEWIGGSFDPEAFDLEEANEALQALRGEAAEVFHTDVVDFVFYPDMSPYLQFFLFRPDQEEKLARVVAKVEAGGTLDEAEWQDVERIGVLMFSADDAGFTADLYLVRGQVGEDEVEDLVDAVDEILGDLPSGMEGGILTLYWMEEFASYDFGPEI
jgi:hypothetical protein